MIYISKSFFTIWPLGLEGKYSSVRYTEVRNLLIIWSDQIWERSLSYYTAHSTDLAVYDMHIFPRMNFIIHYTAIGSPQVESSDNCKI